MGCFQISPKMGIFHKRTFSIFIVVTIFILTLYTQVVYKKHNCPNKQLISDSLCLRGCRADFVNCMGDIHHGEQLITCGSNKLYCSNGCVREALATWRKFLKENGGEGIPQLVKY